MMQPRHKKFLEELPKNGNKIKPSAIKAGYSPMYAHANGRKILKTAMKAQAQEIIESIDATPTKDAKRLMHDLIGMSMNDVYKTLNKIATQDKDYSSALKVLTPLAKELGVELTPDEGNKVIVPVLNIQGEYRSTEPLNPPTIEGKTTDIEA